MLDNWVFTQEPLIKQKLVHEIYTNTKRTERERETEREKFPSPNESNALSNIPLIRFPLHDPFMVRYAKLSLIPNSFS